MKLCNLDGLSKRVTDTQPHCEIAYKYQRVKFDGSYIPFLLVISEY